MSVQTDSYYLHLDDPQAVTLSATRAGSTATDVISYASRLSPKTVQGTFGGVALQSNEQGWNVPHALLSYITDLRPGDTLTDSDATVWHIREVTRDALQTQWNLKCDKGTV